MAAAIHLGTSSSSVRIWPFVLLFADAVWRMPRLVSFAVTAAAGSGPCTRWVSRHRQSQASVGRPYARTCWIGEQLRRRDSHLRNRPVPALSDRVLSRLSEDRPRRASGAAAEFATRCGRSRRQGRAVRYRENRQHWPDRCSSSHYFWVAWTDSSWHEPLTPPQMLERRGCRAGAEISQRDNYHAVMLTPMECP